MTPSPDADRRVEMGVERSTLASITGAKAVANTALRWIPPFLPTLEAALGATTTQLTTILGASEFAGLSTLAIGDHLDRGRERAVMVASLGLVTMSSLIALTGSVVTFAVAFVVLVIGVGNYTVAGHAWISHRVVYRWRARAIGVFEISWALAMLVGAPIVAVLINQFGWRGPFVALAAGSLIAAFVVAFVLPSPASRRPGVDHEPDVHPDGALSDLRRRPVMNRRARLVVSGSALLALAGMSVFVVSGSWLSDSFDVSTGGIGVVAMGFGAVELTASTSIVAFADRLGKMRSTLAGICTVLAGVGIISVAGDRLAIGVVGLLVFLLGFEYGFVTGLSLTSEAMPEARGATLAIGNAVGTLARGAGIILSGVLYGAFGIGGSVTLSACAAAGSLTCYALSRRQPAPAH